MQPLHARENFAKCSYSCGNPLCSLPSANNMPTTITSNTPYEITKNPRKQLGPVELVVLSFPGNRFRGEIVRELAKLVDNDIIRVIDILFVKKDAKGTVTVMELSELEDEDYAAFDMVVAQDMDGMLNEGDVREFTKKIENNSSAAVMLFENRWALDFVNAVERAKGQVVMNERIPRETVNEALKYQPN